MTTNFKDKSMAAPEQSIAPHAKRYKFAALFILLGAACVYAPLTMAFNWQYSGKLIDAHNQFGCDSKTENIKRLINSSGIDYTLLSARFPCSQEDPFAAHLRIQEVISSSPNKIGLLISTKIGGGAGTSNRAHKTLLKAEQELLHSSYGYAEILVQHHEVDDRGVQFGGLNISLYSPEIQRTIEVVLRSKKPLILHIEPRDHPESAGKILSELDQLLRSLSSHPVFLIHLGQLDATQASDFLSRHKNINLILSTVDPLSQRGIQRRAKKGETAQSGWINIFEDDGRNYSRKNFDAYAARLNIKNEWRDLLERFPDRFVIGIESVYAEPWLNSYELKVKLWRYALSKLKPNVARMIACDNAVRNWSLPLSC
jgi:hypothetical protein